MDLKYFKEDKEMMFENLYGILTMANNYDERKVDNTKTDVFEVDTALVTDRDWTYETAIKHKDFNNGDWIIVEGCYNKEEAQAMHDKWVEIMKKDDYDIFTDIWLEEDFMRGVEEDE